MNFIRRWIKALRSRKYLQTTNVMRSARGFCCLGVAYDIEGKSKWISGAYRRIGGGQFSDDFYIEDPPTGPRDPRRVKFPSDHALKRWGISTKIAHELAQMNDDECTFEEIADRLEDYYFDEGSLRGQRR